MISIEAFAALHAGAPHGYADWLQTFAWAALGNAIGGVGLVTTLRLIQVGADDLRAERERPKGERRDHDDGGGVEGQEGASAEEEQPDRG